SRPRPHGPLHRPGLRVPRRGRAGHQLPPAPIQPARHDLGVRRTRAGPRRLRRGDRRGLPVLLLRRCDADPVSGAAASTGFAWRPLREDATGARAGIMTTRHGEVPTPAFMPVGTQGTVKALTGEDLRASGCTILLGNTYHLALRPGAERIERLGGL